MDYLIKTRSAVNLELAIEYLYFDTTFNCQYLEVGDRLVITPTADQAHINGYAVVFTVKTRSAVAVERDAGFEWDILETSPQNPDGTYVYTYEFEEEFDLISVEEAEEMASLYAPDGYRHVLKLENAFDASLKVIASSEKKAKEYLNDAYKNLKVKSNYKISLPPKKAKLAVLDFMSVIVTYDIKDEAALEGVAYGVLNKYTK